MAWRDKILEKPHFRGDKVIWYIFGVLCVVSLIAIYSSTSTIVYKQADQMAPLMKHFAFLMIGFGFAMGLARVSPRMFVWLMLLLPLFIVLLFYTSMFAESVNGAQRWFSIFGITIQPSELAKLGLVGTVSFLLSRMNSRNEKRMFWRMMAFVGVVCFLIVMENFSTAAILFFVCFVMMIIGQLSLKYILGLGGALVVVGGLAAVLLLSLPPDKLPGRASTWKARIERKFGGAKDVQVFQEQNQNYVKVDGKEVPYEINDENYQESHAKMAVANGWKPIGLPGSGTERDFLPQPYSDFIFAIIIEETGVLGALFVMSLYFFLMIRGGLVARRCTKLFPKFLILGCTTLLVFQALVNMAVAVGLVPVTGQPLPLISRGGTSTIITCIYFGIILACSNTKEDEPAVTVDEDVANVHYE